MNWAGHKPNGIELSSSKSSCSVSRTRWPRNESKQRLRRDLTTEICRPSWGCRQSYSRRTFSKGCKWSTKQHRWRSLLPREGKTAYMEAHHALIPSITLEHPLSSKERGLVILCDKVSSSDLSNSTSSSKTDLSGNPSSSSCQTHTRDDECLLWIPSQRALWWKSRWWME